MRTLPRAELRDMRTLPHAMEILFRLLSHIFHVQNGHAVGNRAHVKAGMNLACASVKSLLQKFRDIEFWDHSSGAVCFVAVAHAALALNSVYPTCMDIGCLAGCMQQRPFATCARILSM
jgi:hypothetical protein